MIPTQVRQYLDENAERFVSELREYVKFPSISAQDAHGKDVQACAEWLAGHLEGVGLEARLCNTSGHPVVLARTPRRAGGKRKHFLVYGHYDVQPVEPLDLWKSPPFEPRVENGILYGRGACDNKGQHFAHVKAVEACLKTGTDLPCDLTFLIEGEEEVGSKSLAAFLKEHRADLRCDAVVISDTGMPARGLPALTYGLRGITAVEVKLSGPSIDLHSGVFGGSVDNPAMALCQMLARLRDKRGRIAIPGFYDDVLPLTKYERGQLARLPFNEKAYRRSVGVPRLFGEKGYTPWEQRTARPTVEINGLTSGYQGEGSKTIIPSFASAKLTFRLVPNQDPRRITRAVCRHLRHICPPSVRLDLTAGHVGQPYWVSPTGGIARAGLLALKEAFGVEPVLHREGGSISILADFKNILGVDSLLLGLALPDDNTHAPNEKFELDNFTKGMRLGAALWPELAAAE